jgi:Na+/H+ antiporter NhaC
MLEPSATSLIPIIITLSLSLYTRNVIIGLFSGVFVGVLMLNGPSPLTGLSTMVSNHIVPELTDSYNAGVLVLLAFIGGFVALVEQSGGGAAFAKSINDWVKTRVQAQLAAWVGGIAIFFSDLGTPLIIGPVFRPLTDRLKISRQKLAYIIDSTSSPVAILIPFIGWGVYIMSLMSQEFAALDMDENEFSAFIRTIPFQFYAWLAVVLVPLLTLLRLDFGPMAEVEAAALKEDTSMSSEQKENAVIPFTHPNAKPILVWAPLCLLAIVLCIILVPQGFPTQQVSGSAFRAGLSTAYFSAATLLIILMAGLKVRSILQSIDIYLKGMAGMTLVAVTLLLAWALSDVGRELGAASYIAAVAQASLPFWLLPAIVFVLSAIISFATGSSWGTFAIMFPLVIPTAIIIGAPLYVCMGAVLSGGLFGDHSSPISETTILSSIGANCSQLEHFRTQLPYALFNGIISIIAFLIAGLTGANLIIIGALLLQAALLIVLAKRKLKWVTTDLAN